MAIETFEIVAKNVRYNIGRSLSVYYGTGFTCR